MKVKLHGIHALIDGEYELDASYFTNGELHEIKVRTGILAAQLGDAFEQGDSDMNVALAWTAVMRSDKPIPAGVLWDALFGARGGQVVLDFTKEGDALPPAETPAPESEQHESERASGESSGNASTPPSETPSGDQPAPSPDGQPEIAPSPTGALS